MEFEILIFQELARIIEEAEIMYEDDKMWPAPDRIGQFFLFPSFLSGFHLSFL